MRRQLFPEASSDIISDYELGPVLGKGAFGVVRLATDLRTGKQRACKTIMKARLITVDEAEAVRREVQILHLLTPHKNLAGLIALYEDRKYVHIVMEYCAGGELFDRIVSRGMLTEAQAARFCREMAEMVAHCHSCCVMHRDIKPENFLLSNASDDATLLACDFGLGTFFRKGQSFSELVGSPYYVAPEILRRQYGPEADLWSLGVVLYILLSGIPPFWGPTDKEIFAAILQGKVNFEYAPWPRVSDNAKDLVKRLLTLNPDQRISVSAMLEHPWLREHGLAPDIPLDNVVIARMRRFSSLTKLKKAAVLSAAQYLNQSQIQGLRELFSSFDTDGDGQITFEELRKGLNSHGAGAALTDDDVRSVMAATDVDGSGTIDYNEFLAATVNVALLQREDILLKLFNDIDADGSGTLTIEEIEAAIRRSPFGFGPVDHEEVMELVRRADTNGDGVVDFDEFLAVWRQSGAGGVAEAADVVRRGLSSAANEVIGLGDLQKAAA